MKNTFKKAAALFLVSATMLAASSCASDKMPDANDADSIIIKSDGSFGEAKRTPRPVPSESPKPEASAGVTKPDTIYEFEDVEKTKDKLAAIVGSAVFETSDTGMGYVDRAKLLDSAYEGTVEIRYYPNGVVAETSFMLTAGKIPVETIDVETLPAPLPTDGLPEDAPLPSLLPGKAPSAQSSIKLKGIADEFARYAEAFTGQQINETYPDALADELRHAAENDAEPRELTAGDGGEMFTLILTYSDGKFKLSC